MSSHFPPSIPSLADRMPCGLLMFRDDGIIADANSTLLGWVERSREEIVSKHIDAIFPPGGRIFYQTHFFPLLRAAGTISEIYFALRTASGAELPVLMTAIREVTDGVGANLATFVVINNRQQFEGALLEAWKSEQNARSEADRAARELDMLNAELQATNAALREASEALQQSNAAKDEFIGLVAHELKNPLALLAGNMRVLAQSVEQLPAVEMRQSLDELQTEFLRLSTVVDNLLIVARADIGRQVELQPMHVQRLVEALVAREHGQFPGTPIRLEVSPGLPFAVGSPELVEQILGNFISNARKYGRPGSEVVVTLQARGSMLELGVANEGEVLSEEEVRRFFEPFFRAEAHRRTVQGTGLGLTVCQRLAEAQGGAISGSPRRGGGLVMTLTIPVLDDD